MSTTQNINFETITFIDSKAAQSRPDFYMPVTLNINAVLKSWQFSVFSFEWINKDASVKPLDALKERDQQKRQAVENAINNNEPIEKPVLGLGIQDTIEIGNATMAKPYSVPLPRWASRPSPSTSPNPMKAISKI